MKQEIRKLLVKIINSNNLMGFSEIPFLVEKYNSLLERLQQKYPNNTVIQSKLPVTYQPFISNPIYDMEHNCSLFLDSLTEESKISQNNINITIGSLHGDFSFENIINTIQQTNITNKVEIINYVKDFRNELQKPNPDKLKIKKIIEKLQDLGVGIVSGLLVEVGKKFIGL